MGSFLKFYIAKTDKSDCFVCGAQILEGEEFCVQFLSKNTKYGRWTRTMLFHTEDCYQEWLNNNYIKQLLEWRRNLDYTEPKTVKPKRGRPVKYDNPPKGVQINRMKTLLNYYKKVSGKKNKITALQEKISKLTV